jgi:serine protease Do
MNAIVRSIQLAVVLLPVFALASAGDGSADLAQFSSAESRAVERTYRSLVRITAVSEVPGSGRLEKRLGSGSGVIISEEGHLITNHHVAGRGTRMRCRLHDGEEVDAWLVASDALTDLAILQLDLAHRRNPERLEPARLGDSEQLRVGDVVLAMGSPAGVSQSVTKGIVSNLQLMLPSLSRAELWEEGEAVGSVVRWIGHDAVIFPGNSGGPLVNLAGEVVGINEIVFGSLGGAIPSNLAREVAAQLIRHGQVERSWTGIEGQPRPRNAEGDRGVLVGGVWPLSPAAIAGLRPGDILLEYDGEPVDVRIPEDLPAFNRRLLSTPVGRTVAIRAVRQGETLALELTTEARGKAQGDEVELPEWGMVGRGLTQLSALERERPDTNGVLVASVGLASAVANAKPPIAQGDILVEVAGRSLRGVAQLQALTAELIEQSPERHPVLVKFDRGRVRYMTVVRIGNEPERPEIARSRRPGLAAELQALSPDLAEALGLKGRGGALVTLVYPGRAADRAGLRQGDLLVKLDGDPIRCERSEEVEDLYSQVRRYRVGRQIECEVLREGHPVTLTIELEEDLQTAEDRQRYRDEAFDMTLERLTELTRIHRNLAPDLAAVNVAQVETGGWAQLAGLQGGDLILSIDDQRTGEVSEAEVLLKRAAATRTRRVVLFVRRGIRTMFIELEPSWPPAVPATAVSTSPNRSPTPPDIP